MMSVRLLALAIGVYVVGGVTVSPTIAPSMTSAPSISPTPVPTPLTWAPTLKPTQFPTMVVATSGNASIAEALAIMIVMALIGLFLGVGNMKQDYDRMKKKLKKVSNNKHRH